MIDELRPDDNAAGAERFREPSVMRLKPIAEPPPRDRPILAWCDHASDPFMEDGSNRLTSYAAWVEGHGTRVPNGFNVIKWEDGYDHDNAPEGPRETMPGWWFLRDDIGETPANPVAWCELPPDWTGSANG